MTSTSTNCAPNSTTSPSRRRRAGAPPREERIIAGFEEIQRFVEKHGRAPQHGEDRDIFERLYAVRLDRLRALEECRSLLAPLDHQGLLAGAETAAAAPVESMDEDELLAELEGAAGASDITELRHVRTSADKRAAEEIANRQKCEDFERFKPLFEQVQKEIESGVRQTRPFELKAEIRPGSWFIVGGQKAYVAEVGEVFSNAQGRTRCAPARHLRQRHREQPAHALACSARSTRTRRGGGSPIPSPGRCSPMRRERTIWQAARSMSCAASPTIRSSRPTAMFCTRSA